MLKQTSLFSQLLNLFPRADFLKLVEKYKSDYHSKGFRSWDQFVSMLFCHLASAKSLREICNGLKSCLGKLNHIGIVKIPNKSTLSYANNNRPWELYQDLFYNLLHKPKSYSPKHKFRFKNKMLSLDATVIDLSLSMFPWAKFRRAKGAIKLHMLLDHDGYLPTFTYIDNAKVHEINVARNLELPQDSIIAMDRAYNDFELYKKWTDQKVWFVTRLKWNTKYEVIKRNKVKSKNILKDEVIKLTGTGADKKCPYYLRRVLVFDPTKDRQIALLTNITKFAASTISEIYKERWQIETFFKILKQNLKVKTFVGTSKNAIKIQIWTALIAILLIKLLQFKSRINWSLSNLIALLRMNLFTYRDLWLWINNPFDTHTDNNIAIQKQLFPELFRTAKNYNNKNRRLIF